MKKIPIGLTLLVLLGWTGDAPNSTPRHEVATPPRVLDVKMVDKGGGQWRFEPSELEVVIGDVVRFVQEDVVPHNVEFRDVPSGTDLGSAVMGPFLLQKGETYELRIDDRFAPGDHEYVCTPHEPLGMTGTITVSASGPKEKQ